MSALDLECPQCHAKPGQHCRGGITAGRVSTHLRRVSATIVPLEIDDDVPEGWEEQPVIDVDLGADRDTRPPKPCCKRIRSAAGSAQWCGLPDPHPGQDCHGLGPTEMPASDFGPRRKR